MSDDSEKLNNSGSLSHLNNVHRKIVDSIHQTQVEMQVSVYKPIVEARVNALLMIEDSMNFYQYNIDIKPGEVTHFAMSYLVKILNTLLKHNKDLYKEISK